MYKFDNNEEKQMDLIKRLSVHEDTELLYPICAADLKPENELIIAVRPHSDLRLIAVLRNKSLITEEAMNILKGVYSKKAKRKISQQDAPPAKRM